MVCLYLFSPVDILKWVLREAHRYMFLGLSGNRASKSYFEFGTVLPNVRSSDNKPPPPYYEIARSSFGKLQTRGKHQFVPNRHPLTCSDVLTGWVGYISSAKVPTVS